MDQISSKDLDYKRLSRKYITHEEIIPAWGQAGLVIDRMYGPKSNTGSHLPWGDTRQKFRFRPGELTIWAGDNGSGKSLLTGQVLMQAFKEGETALVASMEMSPPATLERMVQQASGCRNPSDQFIYAFHEWLDGKMWLYNKQSTIRPEQIFAALIYAGMEVMKDGSIVKINHVMIDSLMKCGVKVDDYNMQKLFVDQLTEYAKHLDFHVHLVAHNRKPDEKHSRRQNRYGVKGTSELTDMADNVLIVSRNFSKEEEKRRPDRSIALLSKKELVARENLLGQPDAWLICDKQRHGSGWTGCVNLWYDHESRQFLDYERGRPMMFFKFNGVETDVAPTEINVVA